MSAPAFTAAEKLAAVERHVDMLQDALSRGAPIDDIPVWEAIGRDYFNPLAQRIIESGSIPEPNSGCWIWTRAHFVGGYGSVGFMGRSYRAPRLSFAAYHRPPGRLFVCHRCDNPTCVNPDHLFAASHRDNMADMVRKGRHVAPKGARHGRHTKPWRTARGARNGTHTKPETRVIGERNHRCRHSDETIAAVRAAIGTQREIAARFGITQSHVSKIRRGEARKAIAADYRAAAEKERLI